MSCLVGYVHRLHTFGTATGNAVNGFAVFVIKACALTVSVLGDDEYGLVAVVLNTDHTDSAVLTVLFEADSAHTAGCSTHGAHEIFGEADNLAVVGGDEHLTFAVGKGNTYESIAFTQSDGVDTIGARTAVRLQGGLLHQAVARSEDEVVVLHVIGIVESFDVDESADFVALFEVDDVLNGASFGLAVAFGQVIDFLPIEAT